MQRSPSRDAEIQGHTSSQRPIHLRGEMAVVADPDSCNDGPDSHHDESEHDHNERDEDLPDTLREEPSLSKQERLEHDRAADEGMPSSAA